MRRGALAVVAIAALALALRAHACAGRELWYDDVIRLSQSLYPWDALAFRLPSLDNDKSPLLLALHKLWTSAAGHASLPAIRGFGVLWGVVTVLLALDVARRAAGRAAGLAAACVVAVAPMHVKWSVEVHDYLPAAAAVLATWSVGLRDVAWTLRRWTAFGACAGLAVALFPPTLVAVAPAALLVRRDGARAAGPWCAAAAAAVTAAPCVASIAVSHRIYAEAARAGIGWVPVIRIWEEPVWGTLRLLGLDAATPSVEGIPKPVMLAAAWTVLAALVWTGACAVRAAPAGTPERRRRLALAAGVAAPLVVLVAGSLAGLGIFHERYLIPVGAFAAAGTVSLLALGWRDPGPRRASTRWIVCAGALLCAASAVRALPARADIRSGSDAFRYRSTDLYLEESDRSGPPRLVLVHGFAPALHLLLRVPADALAGADVRHLTTAAWEDVLARDARETVSIPFASGWPFGLRELRGPGRSVGPDAAAALVRAHGGAWVLLDTRGVPRRRHLEEEETARGLDEALGALGTDDLADESIARGVLAYLGLAGEASAAVRRRGHAALVRISLP